MPVSTVRRHPAFSDQKVTSMSGSAAPRIMIDGELCPIDGPARPVLDDGLVRGDGVFEGLRSYQRRPRTPAEHLDRLARSAAGIDLPLDRGQIARELDTLCAAAHAPDCAVRIMLTRGGQRIIREEPLPDLPESWLLSAQAHRITPLLVGSKTLSYAANMQANRRAKAAGAHEALLFDPDDNAILEGPTSSFLWLEGDKVCAPPLSTGILDSITRRLVAEITELHVHARTLEDLQDADGGMLVSTVMELQPIHGILGVVEWSGVPARVAGLRAALAEVSAARAVPASG
jgi:branched-subunit amino acid aminotransferase/4-amino-4-deoxychorismate lyase